MLRQPSISIIVPVFRVAAYLDRCIESIVNQSYDNFEIILVDDGSSDDCAIMCDLRVELDSRIKVIHKMNGGLSSARNYGMQIASGDYVSFIDSDDYVSDDFIESLLSIALERNSDIVECGYVNTYESGECDKYHDDSIVNDYSASEGLSALIDEKTFHQHVWDKIYKWEVVRDIQFEVGKQHEDEFWTYQVFGQADRITKINRTMYFYLQRESSIMGKGYNLRRLDALEGKWNRLKYIEKNFPELAVQAKLDLLGSCIYTMQCVIKYMTGNEKRQAIAIIRGYKKKCRIKFKEIKTLQGSAKKYFYLAKINIFLCCKLKADFNIGF